jgi:hypothetical protein
MRVLRVEAQESAPRGGRAPSQTTEIREIVVTFVPKTLKAGGLSGRNRVQAGT